MRKVAIVDAYSSGNLLAPELSKRGYGVIHIQSSLQIPHGYLSSFKPQDFEQNLMIDPSHLLSIKEVTAELKRQAVCAVITGSEPGVMVSDMLSETLGLKSNGTRLSHCRRDKFEMIEQVRRAGVPAPLQSSQHSLSETLEWIQTHTDYPVVLKPINSAGTDSVAICKNAEEVQVGFDAIFGKTNRLAQLNEKVLVQEFLAGTEYAVNTVSESGHHFTSSIWKYVKSPIGKTDISFYDKDELVAPDQAEFGILSAYSQQVLQALGIQFGPAHIEIMVTQRGPVLIELGARMSGATMPDLDLATAGFGQVDLSIDAYLDPLAFHAKSEKITQSKRASQLVTIRNELTGQILEQAGLNQILKLESYFSSRIKFKPGDFLPPTRNVFTSPGFVILSHPDASVVERDYQRIREIEQNGIFTVE